MKKNREQILAELVAILKESGLYPEPDERNVEPVTDAFSFYDDLGLDSLDLVELVLKVEKQYDLSVPDEVYEHLITVGDLVNYLVENQKD